MGLLRAEQGDLTGAERCLRTALKTDPQFAEAAYNLGVLLAADRIEEALSLCRRAVTLRPSEPKYGYTLAFYLHQNGYADDAAASLEEVIERHPAYVDAYFLLASIHQEQGAVEKADAVYRKALAVKELPDAARSRLAAARERLGR